MLPSSSRILTEAEVTSYEAALDRLVRQLCCPTCGVDPGAPCDWSWALPLRMKLSHVRRYDAAAAAGLVEPLLTEIRVKWQVAGAIALTKKDK